MHGSRAAWKSAVRNHFSGACFSANDANKNLKTKPATTPAAKYLNETSKLVESLQKPNQQPPSQKSWGFSGKIFTLMEPQALSKD